MKKQIIIFLIMICLAGILAAQGTPGLVFTLIELNRYSVSRGTATGAHIEIPETHYGGPVVMIAAEGFQNYTQMTSITLPNSVRTIGQAAFAGCTNLASINIPEGFIGLGQAAFRDCRSLTSITIPYNAYFTRIRAFAFSGCTNLTSINIPNSVTSIEDRAFQDCSRLTEINIPESVTSIGNYVFYGCSRLSSINIPDGVTSIGNYTFSDCSRLTSINLPDSVTSIGNYAFFRCTNLTSINIPDGVTSIGHNAFQDCSSLTSVGNIPDSVTSIGSEAFRACTSLTSINIPIGVTTIENSTFQTCSSLTEINIADSVTSIGEYAFAACNNLAEINIPDSVTDIGVAAFHSCHSLTEINIPDSVIDMGSFAFTNCTSLTSINIPESITSIRNSTFSLCSSLPAIFIPISITSMGAAFYGCTNLTIYAEAESRPAGWDASWNSSNRPVVWGYEGTPPNPPTDIRITEITEQHIRLEWDFYTSRNVDVHSGFKVYRRIAGADTEEIVATITDPAQTYFEDDTITPWSEDFVYRVTAINTVPASESAPSNIAIAHSLIFSFASDTYRVTGGTATSPATHYAIPDTYNGLPVTEISNNAFYNFSNMVSITIGNNVTRIGSGAFRECTRLESIIIPNSVTVIANNAFRDCTSLSSVVFANENGVAGINMGDSIFRGCTSLRTIDLDGITEIPQYMFTDCTSLESIIIPNTVTVIANNAFRDCTSLSSVVFANENGVAGITMGNGIFRGCTSLRTIDLSGIIEIPSNTFTDCTSLEYFHIENEVTSIRNNAFDGCTSLTTIFIPINVTTIAANVFANCDNLTIYAEALAQPADWNANWNSSNRPVIWNYMNQALPPSALSAVYGYGAINLSWTAPVTVEHWTFSHFLVYKDGLQIAEEIAELYYVDDDFELDTEYEYHITSVYSVPSVESVPSNIVFITPQRAAPLPAINPNPANAAINVSVNRTLTWSANPAGETPTGYKIYISTENIDLSPENQRNIQIYRGDAASVDNCPPPTPPINVGGVVKDMNVGGYRSDPITVTDPSYTPDIPLEQHTTYFWQVVPFNDIGDAEDCPVWSFTTIAPQIFRVYGVVRAEGEGDTVIKGATVTLYDYEVNEAGSDTTGDDGTYEIANILAGGYTVTVTKGTHTYNWTGTIPLLFDYLLNLSVPETFVGESDVPQVYTTGLGGNYPNPFNPETTIAFEIANDTNVCIDIYNIRGQLVRNLVNDMYGAGKHSIVWNGDDTTGRNVGSGIYFYQMTTDRYSAVKRMVLMK